MTKPTRFMSLALAGALGITLIAPSAAHASPEGRRNTEIALGAAALGAIIYGITSSGHDHDDWGRYRHYDRYDYGYDRGYGRYGGYGRYDGRGRRDGRRGRW